MNFYRAIALALLLPLLAACAAGGGARAPLTDEQQLTTRPMARWDHLIKGEVEQAWDYLSPGYRSTRDRQAYIDSMSSRPLVWLSSEYHSHDCDQNGLFCTVNLKVTFRVKSQTLGVGEIESYSFLSERWIKSGEIWYHVPEDVSG